MFLHSARLPARQDGSGGLLLLEEQNRALWNEEEIQRGLSWLSRSAEGEAFSRYHAEAGIAAEDCLAPSFRKTRWSRIVECYELLDRVARSALHTLNRAVAWLSGAAQPMDSSCSKGSSLRPGSSAPTSGRRYSPIYTGAADTRSPHDAIAPRRSLPRHPRP
jgi:hypothetical protein